MERVYPVSVSLLCPVDTNGVVDVFHEGSDGGKGHKIIRETGRFDRKERGDSCGGSGKSEGYSQSCPKCHGNGKVEIQRPCSRCGGKGTVATGSKVTCPVCGGKCKLTCERCGGKGFTYRPKQ